MQKIINKSLNIRENTRKAKTFSKLCYDIC